MNESEELERLLKLFKAYYNINRNEKEPFYASAVFHSHNGQYFLSKSISLGEAESHEYVFFCICEFLDKRIIENFINEAWKRGLEQVHPTTDHRNSDIILIVLSKNITKEAINCIQKCKLFKSYSALFKGWSAFKVLALNTSTGEIFSNKRGKELERILKNYKGE